MYRTAQFIMSAVQAPFDTPVLFIRLSDGNLSLAKLEDIQALQQQLAGVAQRLDEAEVLLNRVVDKEQAKQELQGFTLFRAPNTLLEAIRAFLSEHPA